MNAVLRPSHQPVVEPRYVLPALAVLLVQIGLYLWMAGRGFEFTDEAYYLHNYLHWREFTGTVTFFGAYFELPFRMVGQNIAAMRVLSLALVIGSAAVLASQLLRFEFGGQAEAGSGRRLAWYIVAPVASAMLFFSFLTTLRAPSYNLLSIVTIALMTACVLRMLARTPVQRPVLLCFAYGLALGMCFLSKATTSVAVTLAHLAFFGALFRDWKAPWLLHGFLAIVAGFALNFIMLQIAFPQWLDALSEGIDLIRIRDGAYGPMYMFNSFRWDAQTALLSAGPWLLMAAVTLFALQRKIRNGSHSAVAMVALAAVAGVAISIVVAPQGKSWLLVVTASTCALWLTERWARREKDDRYDVQRDIALMLLLLFLPVAFSYGTNMSVLAHSMIAGLFAFCAIYLRLYRLADARLLKPAVLAACLLMMCLPSLMVQWRAWSDVAHTYRIATSMEQQDLPVKLAGMRGSVYVDPATKKALEDVQAMARDAGMRPGQYILDLTGDGPGLIYILGGKPLGSPWLLGGLPGSVASVEQVMMKVDAQKIRHAWVLVSVDNTRRIKDWQDMLARRIGAGTHRLAGEAMVWNPHSRSPNQPRRVNVQLWKPIAVDEGVRMMQSDTSHSPIASYIN